jgi:hypothetical protein
MIMNRTEKYVKDSLRPALHEVLHNPYILGVHNGLSPYEKALIYNYTKEGYKSINEALRENTGKRLPVESQLLKAALKKLPDHRGVVYRSVDLSRKQINSYKNAVGDVIKESTFISSSRSPLIARMLPSFTAKFSIISKHGKSVESISYMGLYNPPNEEEVLFAAGTSFRVLDVTDKEEYVLITMEEV